jgi:hypothetical protein
MNRREALHSVAVLTGGLIVGSSAFLTGCKLRGNQKDLFSTEDLAMLDEIGETFLPATPGIPGAKAARIGEFMKTMVTDCYKPDDQKIFLEGIQKTNEISNMEFGKSFVLLSKGEKNTILLTVAKEAKNNKKNANQEYSPVHYFYMLKQLTLLGYFTSEVGATKALRYLPVPGRWEPCIPYKEGEKAWAL